MVEHTVDAFLREVLALQQAHLPRYRHRLGIQLTNACPVGCSHCLWSCGTQESMDLPLELLDRCLTEWRYIDGAEEVGFTGGEPFYRLDLLAEAVRRAARLGLAPSVATSANWASSSEAALHCLQDLPGLRFLALSIDRYHQQKVPPQHVLNAIQAARRLGIEVRMLMVLSGLQARVDLLPFVDYLYSEIQPEMVQIAGLLNLGRAAAGERPSYGNARAVCGGLDVPLVLSTGDIYVCCAYSAAGLRASPFWRQNLRDVSLVDALREDDEEYWMLQCLRSGGPALLSRLSCQEPPDQVSSLSTCEWCLQLLGNPSQRAGVLAAMRGAEARFEIATSLAQLRGETEPLVRYMLGK